MSNRRVQDIILELNNVAEQRKELVDWIWTLESHGERLRLELLKVLGLNPLTNNGTSSRSVEHR